MSLYRNTPTATCTGILQGLLCGNSPGASVNGAPSVTVQYRILQLLLYRDSATITVHCAGILQVLLYRDTKTDTPVVTV
jgi:hypothetical protein